MKRFINILLIVSIGTFVQLSLASCRGKSAAKAVEFIESAANKGRKAAGGLSKHGDDVIRAIGTSNSSSSKLKPVTYQCPTCAGNGEVNFYDQYGNYVYTGTCPDCNGEGTIIKYEYDSPK